MKKSSDGEVPTNPRVFAILRDRIMGGSLLPGTSLSSARIAREMKTQRSAAAAALDQLAAEGYLERSTGSSYSVAEGAAFKMEALPDAIAPVAGRVAPYRFDLIDFRPGVPDLGRFPTRLWQRIETETWRAALPLDLSYGQPEGRPELRREIARHLGTHRGVRCHPEQIIVTNGSTQALSIAAGQLLKGRTPSCIVEDPGSAADAAAGRRRGCAYHPRARRRAGTRDLGTAAACTALLCPRHPLPPVSAGRDAAGAATRPAPRLCAQSLRLCHRGGLRRGFPLRLPCRQLAPGSLPVPRHLRRDVQHDRLSLAEDRVHRGAAEACRRDAGRKAARGCPHGGRPRSLPWRVS